jgi:hypothetical protein
MPTLRVTLDRETYDALVEHAQRHRRPVGWHAEVLLRLAVGLPFPPEDQAPPPSETPPPDVC